MTAHKQCPPSLEPAFSPNISDVSFIQSTAAVQYSQREMQAVDKKDTFVFLTPHLTNCSADTVVTIQYCYKTSVIYMDSVQSIFDFLFLTQDTDRNVLTVNDRIDVRTTPQSSTCAVPENDENFLICCDTTDATRIPSIGGTLSIGVRSAQPRNSLLQFFTTTDYSGEQYMTTLSDSSVGAAFAFNEAMPSNGSLVLRFMIRK